MTAAIIKVPDGMSCINAFHALMIHAPNQNTQHLDTYEKVTRLFRGTINTDLFLELEALVFVNFRNFPLINVKIFDQRYGIGAAQDALYNYLNIPPERRLDKNDSFEF